MVQPTAARVRKAARALRSGGCRQTQQRSACPRVARWARVVGRGECFCKGRASAVYSPERDDAPLVSVGLW
eukprot:14589618-Alexandrium_andersonii.AAC.1